jgi:hypothetical protein
VKRGAAPKTETPNSLGAALATNGEGARSRSALTAASCVRRRSSLRFCHRCAFPFGARKPAPIAITAAATARGAGR